MTAVERRNPFESIRREDEHGEHWSARDLQTPLGYDQWRRFEDTIERAQAAATNSGQNATDHFANAGKMVEIGSGAVRYVQDYRLTRYGAYLVAMNGDPRKPEIAAAQTYFAVKTREAETAPNRQLDPVHNLQDLALVLQAGTAALNRALTAEAKVAELEPAAEAWDVLAADAGDFSVREAAQVLSRDEQISIGQNRLFGFLREIRWIDPHNAPYQSQVDNGRLVRRVTDWSDDFGQRFVKVQPRVTAKGLAELRKRLGSDVPGGLSLLPGGAA